jgi:peptidoglycan hydrolase CwlO-like protein
MKKNWFLCLLILVFVVVGCGLGEQTDEANKMTEEINQIGQKFNEGSEKTTNLFNKLFGDNYEGVADLKKYKSDNSADFDELVKLLDQQIRYSKDSADKGSEILKLTLDEKFKDYISTNVEINKKTGESDQLMLDFVKSFLDSDDIGKANEIISDYEKKAKELNKEIDELKQKAEKIQKENPDAISKTE